MSDDTLTHDTDGAATQIEIEAGATSAAGETVVEVDAVAQVEGPSAVELAEAITASAAALAQPVAPAPPATVEERPMGAVQRSMIGGALIVVTLALMTQLLAIWPAVMAATVIEPEKPRAVATPLLLGIVHLSFDPQVVLIAMVMLVGALGALVGSSLRFLHFATRDELTKRDEWSYFVRPMQGAALALIVYFTLRGGYLGQDQNAPVNPFGVAALSALVGLFTRHAVSKLTDVFDTLFGEPKEDVEPPKVITQPHGDAAPESGANPGSV